MIRDRHTNKWYVDFPCQHVTCLISESLNITIHITIDNQITELVNEFKKGDRVLKYGPKEDKVAQVKVVEMTPGALY